MKNAHEQQDSAYAKHLINGVKLRWNILVGHVASGGAAKLDHMDVLEATKDIIVAGEKESGRVFMTFKKEDILRAGIPQVNHFNIRYFDAKGIEIRSTKPRDMSTCGAKPISTRRLVESGYEP